MLREESLNFKIHSIKSLITIALLLAVYRSLRGSFCFVLRRTHILSLSLSLSLSPLEGVESTGEGLIASSSRNRWITRAQRVSNLTFLDSCNDTTISSGYFPMTWLATVRLPVTIDPGSSTKASIERILASRTRRTSGRGILNISLIVRFILARWFPIYDWSGADDGVRPFERKKRDCIGRRKD